jgi:glycosyltransferase involved in cell wall biosynthesis
LGLHNWFLQQLGCLGVSLPGLRQRIYVAAIWFRRNRKSIRVLKRRIDEQNRQLQVRTVMDWIAVAPLRTAPLVSVVLPTRDRCGLLPRAIASVMGQSYDNWELLVVDDESVDGTPAFMAGIADERIRAFRGRGAGVCAARNVALAQARGALVAYLDDDNIMHPGWLKAVLWAFEQHPATEVLYGAFIVDDKARLAGHGKGQMPQLYFHSYSYRGAAKHNIADMGCIAHRAELPEARFDESLREFGDWDLFLRLTRHSKPLALPAIACFYTTDAPNRLSWGPTFHAEKALVQAKNHR